MQNYNESMDIKAITKKIYKPRANLAWGEVLDELRAKESIDSDAELARSLGVSRGYISLIRKRKKGLSPRLAEDVYRRLGRENQSHLIEASLVAEKVLLRSNTLIQLREFIIDRANGVCQLCNKQAPFLDIKGKPYLETHHVKPMKNGGEHAPNNMVALCPNCKKKMGVNPSKTDLDWIKKVVRIYKK